MLYYFGVGTGYVGVRVKGWGEGVGRKPSPSHSFA